MNSSNFLVRPLALAVALVSLAFTASSVNAVTISASLVAPTVNGADIANLSQLTAFEDFGSSFLWVDRPARGQTLTTGGNLLGYTLDSITVQANPGGGNSATVGTANYTVRVGTVSGTSFAQVAAETASFGSVAQNDYVTFLLGTPIMLLPNTLYGFDIGFANPSPNSFSTVGWELRNNSAAFSGGQRYNSGSGGAGSATISLQGPSDSDRILHLNLEANVAAAVPEPATATLGLLSVAGLMLRRRRMV